ncbi:helix-turn-helix domain-containing protein [Paraglaciecola aquimarina]|uniref:Helix-turn-helix domain-containing protein n=1 Tax=Paraglaciecola algarum TaxID=3050085 RepID=A0ABS9DEE2_9ALTE|nr:helix-turn-helix domain-containing protein [Paraglaciecola sp. G1-23]MCF2949961.1 helix-turn-helix domain-containing protein [Paraglaciecola sp. G1-23]
MHKVAILAYNKVATFELACAIEVFALPRPEYDTWYKTEIVSFEPLPIQATGGIKITCKLVQTLSDYDTLIVPSWSAIDKNIRLHMAEQISAFAEQGKRIISLCSGAFLLAQLGLLQAKQATTHWRYAEVFKQRFPNVEYVDDVLYVQNDNIFCSAGSSAALDLGLEIVRQDFGYKVANQVARRLVISPHRSGGQSQYIETPIVKQQGMFSRTLDWAIENINKPLTVNDLASQANMSRRSFDRHFKGALGTSPKSWLNQQRVNLAKQILESENLSVEQLAQKVGYENGITLRFNFNKYVGVAPSQYQAQFNQQ